MGVVSTQGFIFKLVADGQILDLFADEEIKLSDNVTGLFDLGVLPSDFTRQITLPGTKRNNAFFEHVYDISVFNPDTFATNIKVPAYLDFDGLYLAQGYLQLNKVNVIANKFIDSYEVTVFGALSSFAKTISNTFLTQLTNLEIYNHTSSFSNISSSWAGNLFNGDIVYPLAEYGSKLQYTGGDVFFGIDDNEGALSVQDFKPAIRMKKVWDKIFEFAGYSYSSSFFNETHLDDVYLVCNRALKYPVYSGVDLETYGVVTLSPISASGQTDVVVAQTTNTQLPFYNVSKDPSNVIGTSLVYDLPISSSLRGNLTLSLKLSGSLGGPQINLRLMNTSSLAIVSDTTLVNFNQFFYNNTFAKFAEGANGQNQTYEISTPFNTAYVAPGTYKFMIYWDDQFNAPYNNFTFTLDPDGKPKSKLEITKVMNAADNRVIDIATNMPYGTNGIKLIDFIKGVQKKYNLVIYPSKTKKNEFIVETFNNWYKDGQIKNFNKYINLDEKIEVIPANNLAVNELNFGDQLDGDYISQQFAKLANREYGKQYYVDQQNFFSQGKFEVKTTLASSPIVLLSGTGLSGSVEGANPTPPVTSYSYVMGPQGYGTENEACSNTYYYPTIVYSLEGPSPGSVVTLYIDSNCTVPFNGGDQYWKWGLPYYSSKQASYIYTNGDLGTNNTCFI